MYPRQRAKKSSQKSVLKINVTIMKEESSSFFFGWGGVWISDTNIYRGTIFTPALHMQNLLVFIFRLPEKPPPLSRNELKSDCFHFA